MKADWEVKTFEDCIENVKYTTKIPSKDYRQEGQYPIVSQEEELVSGYWDNENDLFNLTKPVVIFGDHTRVLKYVDFDFVLGADGVKILQPKDFLDTKFFMYLLKNANIKHLGYARHYRLLKELNILVPPLPEQKRIVEILDQKFTQIDQLKQNAEKNLQNAKELFQAKLTKAFSNNTWEKKTIVEVCSKKENIKWKNENVSTEYQYIDLSAVDRESKNISDTQIITKESAPSRAQQIVKTGDILFGTTRPTLKRFCLLADEYDGQICSTGFCVIRPNQNIISSDWMFYQFYNDEFYKYIEPLQKGANYPAVTDKDIMNYNIFVPPLPEQKRIVEQLDSLSQKVRQLEEIYTKQIANCDELKQSFLKKAFEGEL